MVISGTQFTTITFEEDVNKETTKYNLDDDELNNILASIYNIGLHESFKFIKTMQKFARLDKWNVNILQFNSLCFLRFTYQMLHG